MDEWFGFAALDASDEGAVTEVFGRPKSAQRITEFCRDWAARETPAEKVGPLTGVPRQVHQSREEPVLDDEAIA